LNVATIQCADHGVFRRFGEALVHRLADARHLPEDRRRRDIGKDELPPIRRQAIELRTTLFQQEHHFAALAWPIEDVACWAGLHPDRVMERFQLRRREVAEQLDHLQISELLIIAFDVDRFWAAHALYSCALGSRQLTPVPTLRKWSGTFL
jgi:hypothetical protein